MAIKKITANDVLEKAGNILDKSNITNINITNIILEPINILLEDLDSLQYLNLIDKANEHILTFIALNFSITRKKNEELETFRKRVKSFVYLRKSNNSIDDIIKALSIRFNIDKKLIGIEESKMSGFIEYININTTVNINEFIQYLKEIKAAGIVISCYRYLVISSVYEVNRFVVGRLNIHKTKEYFIDCNGNIVDFVTTKRILKYGQYKYAQKKDDLLVKEIT